MILRAMPFMGAILILAGCATLSPEDREARCEAAVTILTAYKAARAAGASDPGPGVQAAVAAAAETVVMLRCPAPAAARE